MAKPTGRKRGGQPGNRNALKTGLHTRQMRDMRRTARLRIAALKAATAWARMVLALNQGCHPRPRANPPFEAPRVMLRCERSEPRSTRGAPQGDGFARRRGPRSINRTSSFHFVMAGLDPAIHRNERVFRCADAQRLDGVATLSLATKGGHDELGYGIFLDRPFDPFLDLRLGQRADFGGGNLALAEDHHGGNAAHAIFLSARAGFRRY